MGLTTLRQAIHGPKVPPLAQFLNLWSLGDGVLVGVDLSMSSAYELELDSLRLADPARADLFETQARAFLNALPADVTLQFVVQVRKGDPDAIRAFRRSNAHPDADALSRLVIEKKCEA